MRLLKLVIPAFALTFGLAAQGRPGQVMKELGLSPEQKEQVKAVWKSQKDAMKGLREQRKAAREKLEAALKSAASDDALKAAHQELQGIQNKAANARFENMLAIRKVLTPEQRTKFDRIRMEKIDQISRRFARGHGDDDGEDEE